MYELSVSRVANMHANLAEKQLPFSATTVAKPLVDFVLYLTGPEVTLNFLQTRNFHNFLHDIK